MSDRQLNYHEHEDEEEDDEERDNVYSRFDLIPSSDINKKEVWIYKRVDIKKPRVKLSFQVDQGNAKDMIQAINRPPDIYVKAPYAKVGTFGEAFENQSGKWICKAGVHAEAGVGRARAECGVFEAEAKGPNISGRYEFGVFAKPEGPNASGAEVGMEVGVMARAELASASAKAGPVGVKVGLGVDTGVSFGAGMVDAKILGTGISIGKRNSVAVLGSEVSVDCSIM